VCGPSRACLATGRRYERSGVMGNFHNTPDDLDTVYQHLREAGYAVLGCGKFDLAKASYDWQLDGRSRLETWGFTDGCDSEGKWDGVSSGRETPAGPYLKYLHDHGLAAAHVADMISRQGTHAVRPTPLPEAAYGDNWVGAKAEDLLRHTATDQPWFLQVNCPGPHEPWDITAAMADSARELEALPSPFRGDERLTPAHHHAVRQNYAAMIENIDRWVGRLLQVVAQRGEAERTIVVYASDHGEMLGDHGMWGKSQPQEASVRVPLVVCGAADLPGGEVSRPTDLLDLSASFLSWAGRSVPEAWDSRPMGVGSWWRTRMGVACCSTLLTTRRRPATWRLSSPSRGNAWKPP